MLLKRLFDIFHHSETYMGHSTKGEKFEHFFFAKN